MHRNRFEVLARWFLSALMLALALLPLQAAGAAGAIRYAKPTGRSTGNCTSWSTACTLQRALLVAQPGNKIWVAKGTHKPAAKTDFDPTKTFALKNGVAIYGGFVGGEGTLTQRNFTRNVTILSGDIHTVGDPTDNSYHVVTADSVNSSAVLDGFTIKGGYAVNGLSLDQLDGGGMYLTNASPTLRNLTFTANTAKNRGGGMINNFSSPALTNVKFVSNVVASLGGSIGGGGMYNNASSPRLTKVAFTRNNGANEGGGMVNSSGSAPILNSVTFTGNVAVNGGGMSNNSSSPSLTNVAFIGNQATGSGQGGGGMFNNGANPVLNGVTFSGNTTPGSGGGIFNNNGSNASLTNVTISGNTGSTQGGGIANVLSNPSLNNVTVSGNVGGDGSGMYSEDSTPAVYNSIFWGDNAESPELVNAAPNFTTIVTLVDSVVQGAVSSSGDCFNDTHTACTHVLNTNPRLGALRANGGFTKTLALGSGSSAVNTGGLNVLCAPRDQRGVKRPQGPRCDMGAYEKK